jgi:D-alanyl-D-alanine carboxypeptidase (penicillin-binding protein 5/6)
MILPTEAKGESNMVRHRRRRKRATLRFILLLLLVAMLVFAAVKLFSPTASAPDSQAQHSVAPSSSAQAAVQPTPTPSPTPEPTPTPRPFTPVSSDGLHSSNAILMRVEDGITLMEKGAQEKVYPASLTKIMTALVAIEHLADLNEAFTVTNEILNPLYEANASMAGFTAGEEVKAIDLLYGVVLSSGGECSAVLAIETAGSQSAFVGLMNRKAESLGLADTHFANITGLHDRDHFTTVSDMAVLLHHALQNETFRTLFTTMRHTVGSTNVHPEGVTLYSTMILKMQDPAFAGGRVLGGKTGYTAEAGLCLASLAEKDEEEYILVTVGAGGDHQTEPHNIEDALDVYARID